MLEVGCGDGLRTIELAPWCRRLVAVDIDREAISHACEQRSRANIGYETADARSLPFPAERFDCIVFTHSLHHIGGSMDTAISEAVRVAKTAGLLVIIEPGFDSPFFEAELSLGCCDGDERREKLEAYRAILAARDVEEVEEFYSETLMEFDSLDDFLQTMRPTCSEPARVPRFLEAHGLSLPARKRINILRKGNGRHSHD